MNLKQLETFVVVAEQGSFSRAAEVLGTVQPALSRHVRSLEVELREHLFQRNGRGVELTEAGKRLLTHSRAIQRMVNDIHVDFGENRNEPAGHIVVGLPPSIARRITLPLIEYFSAHLPKARLEILEGFSSHMAEWLLSARVDVCLLYNPQPHPNLDIHPLLQERLCLVGRKGSLPKGPLAFVDLPRFPLIMPQHGQIFRSLMEAQATLQGIHLQPTWEVSSVPVILDLLRHGHGFAVLTESALASQRVDEADALEFRVISKPEIQCALCLAQRSHQRESPLQVHTKKVLQQILLQAPVGLQQ
ncbi:LysR family transcriptional regulator [Lampropedia puyangensis]|uniref:LysR family transcriptional regulator n=1 Tax=Lampropedia puyangensis TaxID=1330072 RepID=A0A4S8EVK3_9BURK|nr:LysR family transcriptional regulator [Lampropedia puyangensis]THT97583.1 LysR family transcriptional regulator [Lampropedia puyangensis]